MGDTNQHETTTEIQARACFFRAQGATYKDISDALNVPENTIKNWFRPGTATRALYNGYCKEMTQVIGTQAIHEIKSLLGESMEVIRDAVTNPKHSQQTRFKAATFIINNALPLVTEEVMNREEALRKWMFIKHPDLKPEDWSLGGMADWKLEQYEAEYQKAQELL